jgi:hypothetical protein
MKSPALNPAWEKATHEIRFGIPYGGSICIVEIKVRQKHFMKKNTAKITDPIWDSRNSDEPDALPLAGGVVSPARTFREHMRVALSRDGNFNLEEVEQIINAAEEDTAMQLIISGSMNKEPKDGQSLVACWELVRCVARGVGLELHKQHGFEGGPMATLIDAAGDLYNAACSLMKQRFCNNDNEWHNLESAAMRFDASKQAATIEAISSQKHKEPPHKQCQNCKAEWTAEGTPNVCPVCGSSVVKIGPVILNGKDRFG